MFGSEAVRRRDLIGAWLTPKELSELTRRSTARAAIILARDTTIYLLFVTLALLPLPIPVGLALGLPTAIAIGILFVIGHDACHQAFTPHRWLNDWIARLTFIPSVHSTTLWIVGHNQIHHQYTNLKSVDYVWEPMTQAEYESASLFKRILYRIYRSPLGPLPYYLIEMWWKKNFLPIAPETRGEWRRHLPHSLFVIFGNMLLVWGVIELGRILAPDRSPWLSAVLGWAWPFFLFNFVIGWTIHAHHTHPEVAWYADRTEWSHHRAQVLSTLHNRPFQPLDAMSNNIMEHNAHHLLPAIPCYRLRRAQSLLRQRLDGILSFTLTPASYIRTVRACKLFDYRKRCWTDFDGTQTGPVLPLQPEPELRPAKGSATE